MNRSLQKLPKQSKDHNRGSEGIFPYGNILKNGWLIASVSLIVATLGIIYALTVTPMYEANILIQITRNAPVSADFQTEIPAATEVEILRSRSILSRVVNALQLDISVEPRLFPVLGGFIAGKNKKISNPGLFGYGGYVWGAELARIAVFNVPVALLRQPFLLTIAGNDEFTLSHKDLALRVKGRVAEMTRVETKYGPIEILVAEIQALPGAQFSITRNPTSQVVEQLQSSLAISEKGKQSNVIGISLRGSKPELISRILNAIGKEYIRQRVTKTSDEAKRALLFYNQQVEESRQRLQKLDARMAQLLGRHGTSDLGEDARALAQQSIALQAKLAEKEQRKVELSARFAELHPEVMIVTRHILDLRRDLKIVEAKRKVLAAVEQEILIVNRDKQSTSEMNAVLLNTRQKLETLTLADDGNVRLVDSAEAPIQPVSLRLSVMIAVACLLGIVLGVIASILKNAIAGWNNKHGAVESVAWIDA